MRLLLLALLGCATLPTPVNPYEDAMAKELLACRDTQACRDRYRDVVVFGRLESRAPGPAGGVLIVLDSSQKSHALMPPEQTLACVLSEGDASRLYVNDRVTLRGAYSGRDPNGRLRLDSCVLLRSQSPPGFHGWH
jgi:hypothetical protein